MNKQFFVRMSRRINIVSKLSDFQISKLEICKNLKTQMFTYAFMILRFYMYKTLKQHVNKHNRKCTNISANRYGVKQPNV